MDAKTTGAFIAALRRDKSMTQRQLAEALAVTDKAVSRWETGKGYPDVETLTALAETLGVTVGEILAGERAGEAHEPSTEAPAAGVAPPTYIYGVPPHIVGELYRKTVSAERRAKGLKIALIVVVCVLAALIVCYEAVGVIQTLRNTVFAYDENCVIAADYSHITYYGRRYVPIEFENDLNADFGAPIVREAAVEGQTKWDKLLFGDKVYGVEGLPDREIICLSTDYDFAPSEYYCLESAVDQMKEYDREAALDVWVISDVDRLDPRAERIGEAIAALSDGDAVELKRSWLERGVTVYVTDERRVFLNQVGTIIKRDGEYYFEDAACGEWTNPRVLIPLPDSLDEDLDGIFRASYFK